MKTLRLTVLALIAASTAAVTFAGPGLAYWNAARTGKTAPQKAPVVAKAEKCDHMTVTLGNVTKTVECTGATAQKAQCKAACGM